MALERTFEDLGGRLDRLREAVNQLRLAASDQPVDGDWVLVDVYGDAAEDGLGWIGEAALAVVGARTSLDGDWDLRPAVRGLATCQRCADQIAARLQGDLLSYERLAEVIAGGRERGRAWRAWSRGVKLSAERCVAPLFDVRQAVGEAWELLCERMMVAHRSPPVRSFGPPTNRRRANPSPGRPGAHVSTEQE